MSGGRSERGVCNEPSQNLRSDVRRVVKSRRASQTQGMRTQRHAVGKPFERGPGRHRTGQKLGRKVRASSGIRKSK